MFESGTVDAPRLLAPSDLLTYGGGLTVIVTASNGLYYAFGWKPKWTGFWASLMIASCAVLLNDVGTWKDWFVVVPNALLLYSSAVGVTTIGAEYRTGSVSAQIAKAGESDPIVEENLPELGAYPRAFWTAWF